MSERSKDERPSGQSPDERRDPTQTPRTAPSPSLQHGQQRGAGQQEAPSPSTQRAPFASSRPFELPPLPRISPQTTGSFLPTASRSAGMTAIFSPGSQDRELQQARRRKASELESPRSTGPALAPLVGNRNEGTDRQSYSSNTPFPPMSERPMLTPRSPSGSLRHSISLNQLSTTRPSVPQSSSYLTSPRSRPYSIHPGTSGAPPLPTPPAAHRANYGFPAPSPQQAHRRASIGAGRSTRPPSSSGSPTTSYSGYSHEQTSPSMQQVSSMSTLSAPYSAPDMAVSELPAATLAGSAHDRLRPGGIPITSSSGPTVYQMMTYETGSGAVQLPVDVHAASRVADEKRRRNAGASARFRQRRKEKEREASTTISRLEQQVKESGEDVDFYRRERDYFAGVLLQVPGGDRHFPRPPSPRRRRSSTATAGTSGGPPPLHSGAVYAGSAPEQAPRPAEEERSVRRRTSSLLPPPPPPAAQQQAPGGGMPQQMQSPYGPPTYSQPFLPQPERQYSQHHQQQQPQHLPQQQSQHHHQQQHTQSAGPHGRLQQSGQSNLPPPPQPQQQQQTAPHLMQAPPQTGPWNPYASDRRPPSSRDGR